MNSADSRSRLADQLVKSGLLTQDQIRRAQEEASRSDMGLCETLIRLGLMEESALVHFVAEQFDFPFVGQESLTAEISIVKRIPPELMRRRDLLPLTQVGSTLSVAMADPTDQAVIDDLAKQTGLKIRPFLAPFSAISEVHHRLRAFESLAQLPQNEFEPDRLIAFFEKFADYRFERLIGSGAFGIVSICRQVSLDRPVAIKVLNPDWNRITHVAERFRREGQIIAKLDHPNIIKVYEQGERDGIRYIVMEYFEGKPINEYLRDREWGQNLIVLLQVCSALTYAHDQGIIHRDIKPANILVSKSGAVKLLDFGIAHYEVTPSDLDKAQMIMGTPKYMAPELRSGADQASPASDLYAFGVMCYEILTGQAPRVEELVHPSQADPRIPRFLGDAVVRCLLPSPAQRPQSFAEMAGFFQQTLDQIVFSETTRELRLNGNQAGPEGIQTRRRLSKEKVKVLVVEDDKTTQKLYERFLVEEIFDRSFAKSGEEALEIYRTWQPDVIILDIMLPEISGYSVLKQIREDFQNKVIPIIISSRLTSKDDILSCAKFGIQGYFTKPINWKEIGSRVLECYHKAFPEMADRVRRLRGRLEARKESKASV